MISMETLADFYNKFYGQKPHPFGVQASELVKELSKYLAPQSTVVDVGAGDGRNSLFLLEKGYSVCAIEPSKVAQDILEPLKGKFSGHLTQITDYAERIPPPTADAALFSFILHHLSREHAIALLKKYKESIPMHGISTFAKESTFAQQVPENFYPTEKELRELYEGWDIVFLKMTDETAAQRKDGVAIINKTIHLVAKKRTTGD